MDKMKKVLIILILLSCKMMVSGQDNMNTGIIYGTDHAYSLTAPEGWVLDNSSGVVQGLYAVFYKQGESWDKAETVM